MDYLKKNLFWLLDSGRLQLAKVASALELPSSSVSKGDIRYIENWIRISDLSGFSLDMLVHLDLSLKDEFKKKGVKFLAMDVDGVLTEGGMFYTEDGTEFKRFHTRDGMGIRLAIAKGISVGIISHGKNENLIRSRAEHLGIDHVYVGKESKLSVLKSWAEKGGWSLDQCAYLGDEINDLEVIDQVGISACPADAIEVVLKNSKVVLRKKGGEGCVREFIEGYLL